MFYTTTKSRTLTTFIAAATAGFLASAAIAEAPASSVKLLTANFESRQVVQVEVGDFHFLPRQVAPTEAIDRRTLPTFDLTDIAINQVDVVETRLPGAGTVILANKVPTVGIVAEGVIELPTQGGNVQHLDHRASRSRDGTDMAEPLAIDRGSCIEQRTGQAGNLPGELRSEAA